MEALKREIEFYKLQEGDINTDFAALCIEKNSDINVDDSFWHECTEDHFLEILEAMGFYDVKCFFRGFWSQGDGACFEGRFSYKKGFKAKLKKCAYYNDEVMEMAARLENIARRARFDLCADIMQSGHYVHEMTMSAELYSDTLGDEIIQDLEEEFLEICRDLARWYYDDLESDYYGLISKEAIFDTLLANDYTFNADGEIV